MSDDRWLDSVVDVLREPVRLDPTFDARVMAEIASPPSAGDRWRRAAARPLLLSPIGGMALAAAALAGILLGRSWLAPAVPESGPDVATVATVPAPPAVQFVIVVPDARSVALVGDFNDWSHTATPMRRAPGDGVWSITVPLREGRYRYAFLVDGDRWLADPSAPRAIEDDFGPPNSVVTVGAS